MSNKQQENEKLKLDQIKQVDQKPIEPSDNIIIEQQMEKKSKNIFQLTKQHESIENRVNKVILPPQINQKNQEFLEKQQLKKQFHQKYPNLINNNYTQKGSDTYLNDIKVRFQLTGEQGQIIKQNNQKNQQIKKEELEKQKPKVLTAEQKMLKIQQQSQNPLNQHIQKQQFDQDLKQFMQKNSVSSLFTQKGSSTKQNLQSNKINVIQNKKFISFGINKNTIQQGSKNFQSQIQEEEQKKKELLKPNINYQTKIINQKFLNQQQNNKESTNNQNISASKNPNDQLNSYSKQQLAENEDRQNDISTNFEKLKLKNKLQQKQNDGENCYLQNFDQIQIQNQKDQHVKNQEYLNTMTKKELNINEQEKSQSHQKQFKMQEEAVNTNQGSDKNTEQTLNIINNQEKQKQHANNKNNKKTKDEQICQSDEEYKIEEYLNKEKKDNKAKIKMPQNKRKSQSKKEDKNKEDYKEGQNLQNEQNEEKNQEDKIQKKGIRKKKNPLKKTTKTNVKANFNKLNLKHKYKEKYRGEISNNKKMFTKNGRLKQKYQQIEKMKQLKEANEAKPDQNKNQIQSVFQQEQTMYQKCLSSALFIDILQDDNSEENSVGQNENQQEQEQKQKQDQQNQVQNLNDEAISQQNQDQNNINNEQKLNSKKQCQDEQNLSLNNQIESDQLLEKTLKEVFGFDSFRQGQKEAIKNILNKENTLAVMSTGHGKSLIYQLPSYLMEGVTIVISPLLSLMLDQISKLPKSLPGCCINSENPCILALTATATTQTQQSIKQKLNIKHIIKGKTVNRPNLIISASKESDLEKFQALLELLNSKKFKNLNSIIIYCMYISQTEKLAQFLITNGYSCKTFHSMVEDKQKRMVQEQFMSGKVRIVIATIAFGMGIDKNNIRAVIHMNMPKTLENYIQEIGRAGRDNQISYCHLFLTDNDYYRQKAFIYSDMVHYNLVKNVFHSIIQQIKQVFYEVNEFNVNENCIDPKQNKIQPQNIQKMEKLLFPTYYLNSDPNNKKRKREEFEQDIEGNYYILKDSDQENLENEQVNISQEELHNYLQEKSRACLKFYKTSPTQISQKSELFEKLLRITKLTQGTHTFNLIKACNMLQKDPIDLINEIRPFSQSDEIYCNFNTDILAFKILEIPSQEEQKQIIKNVFQEMQVYEKTQITKIDFFYIASKLTALPTIKHVENIELKEDFNSQNSNIEQVTSYFDPYFNIEDTNYTSLLKLQNEQLTFQSFLPVRQIDEQEQQDLADKVEQFINTQQFNFNNKEKQHQLQHFLNPLVIARILQGVSSQVFTYEQWKAHPLWGKYIDYDFYEIMDAVRDGISQYEINTNLSKQIKYQ
ncbi:P-loop containing nucleoside triphosphate hydrolase [Pseudocohnilembus persalinus]|uniref:DNA 3'-5' helicase n=1 Tax=Pseudocohnilembus persalinus TaxID=266149 RepID=A0A0V0QPT6_PSEPJ|nr:P-loop containing nucleoside triphosphate hydrolase [Pseudocohnilembus persalinus]|eukprot:KRX04249.1 P-loop containing nucleoside triphosphate hydrolase [Pseudocohnilembus persalinus]